MTSVLENKSFKWIAIGVTVVLTLGVVSAAILVQRNKQQIAEAKREAEKRAVFEYETHARSNLVRIYQNLKIDHFLAAYKNLESIEAPSPRFTDIYREYNEVLYRISKGLIENDFLNEAESLLLKLEMAKEFEDSARELLVQIASRRRWKSALNYISDGKKFLADQKFRDAVTEFQKANAEYESVRLFKIHNVDKELQDLADLMRQARFEIAFAQAQVNLIEAQKSIQANFFLEALERTRKAGDMVARAAFYGGKNERVTQVRRKLVELEGELAFRVPNANPIWNLVSGDQVESSRRYFVLDSTKVDLADPSKVSVTIGYRMRSSIEDPFILRVKVILADGRFFYDGKEIFAENRDKDEKSEKEIRLAFPSNFKGLKVKKVDIEVHDRADKRYSFVQRAFRLASPS